MINKQKQTQNFRRLLDYDEQTRRRDFADDARKLTVQLEFSYHDVVKRIALLEGTTKTELMRRMVDFYAEQFSDDVLFPHSGLDGEQHPRFENWKANRHHADG